MLDLFYRFLINAAVIAIIFRNTLKMREIIAVLIKTINALHSFLLQAISSDYVQIKTRQNLCFILILIFDLCYKLSFN